MNKKLLATFGTAALVLILISTIILASGQEDNSAKNGDTQEKSGENIAQANTVSV